MIERGLNRGAVFEEDGSRYLVDEVLPGGDYISHRITDEEYRKMQSAVEVKRVEASEKAPEKKATVKSAARKTPSVRKANK